MSNVPRTHFDIPMQTFLKTAVLLAAPLGAAVAQDASIVYRLGRDTVAVEQYTRTPSRLTGEMVTRQGAATQRIQYDVVMTDGRPASAIIRRKQPDGSPIPNAPTEYRFTFRPDSAKREIVWRDSTQTQTFAAPNAFVVPPVYAYGLYEVVFARGAGRDSIPALGLGGGVTVVGVQPVGGDTLRMRGGTYPMLAVFSRDGRLQSTNGIYTTNKSIGTRQSAKIDIAAIAPSFKPTGVLSPRAQAHATFGRSPIFINYGRPAVRDRTVWGGTLIPLDTIWRLGANEATHLATSRTITLGDMTLAPGLYTLWLQHTRAGTFLIVNRQVGQWGTEYQASQDIGRVKLEMARTPEHVEDFTITLRAANPTRGIVDFAWGDSVATTSFTVKP